MSDQFKEFEREPAEIWTRLRDEGYDGYDIMEQVSYIGWKVISSWGKDGWDLGSWPYVAVYFKNLIPSPNSYLLVIYVEGDVEEWAFPTKELRQQKIDDLAFFYWKSADVDWVKDYKTIDDVPADSDLRGPVRFHLEQGSEDNNGDK